VTNTATGRAVTATANDLGFYTVSALPPGHYRVETGQKGFKKTVRELDLQIAQVGVADFKLGVGAVTESITVEAGSPVINPADSAIGEVVESRQITELPLNGRNFAACFAGAWRHPWQPDGSSHRRKQQRRNLSVRTVGRGGTCCERPAAAERQLHPRRH